MTEMVKEAMCSDLSAVQGRVCCRDPETEAWLSVADVRHGNH